MAVDADSLANALVAAVDAACYAAVVTALAVVGAIAAAIVSGGDLVRAKALVFLAGFVLMAYATIRLWPSSPEEVGGRRDAVGRVIPRDRTRLEELLEAGPPLRWLPAPPPAYRVSPPSKLFLASVFVLAGSYLMETTFEIV